MKSRANFKGHPLHPILVSFPIAFLYGAFFCDLTGVLLDRDWFWFMGRQLILAGVLPGLVAALPGFIDYRTVVPPASTGGQRALRHALANIGALMVFALSWLLRTGEGLAPGVGLMVLQAVGLVSLTAGGWMGGTLVVRNQIGVDHRYANAGRWRETRVAATAGEPIGLPVPEDLQVDQMMLIHAGSRRVVLGRTTDGYVAFDDRCTHRGASLADGVMMRGTVQCPWHGSQFDTRTGAVSAGPAISRVAAYRVQQTASELRIHLG